MRSGRLTSIPSARSEKLTHLILLDRVSHPSVQHNDQVIGARFDAATLNELKRLCAPLLLTTFTLMVGSILLAGLFVYLMPINALSSYLAATPGGLDSIAVMASELHADATVVLTVHFCRLILVLIFGPGLVSVFAKYCNKWRITEKVAPRIYTKIHEKSTSKIRRSPAASSRPS